MSSFKENLVSNLPTLNNCKTPIEIVKNVNRIYNSSSINSKKEKEYALILKKCLMNSKHLDKSISYIYNYIMNSEKMFVGKTIEKKSWYKGTAIGGMECSNPNR